MIPGWTTATRFSRSISRILSIAVKAIVSPPSMPAAPPDRPVPAPRGTIGTRSSDGDPHELDDVGGRRREDDRARQAGVEVRASRRRGSPRGRACRSGAAGRGGAPRSRQRADRSWRQPASGGSSRRRVYAAGAVANGAAGRMAPMSARTPLILAALLIADHRRLRAGRRAGRRGRSRGRRRSGRAARLGRAAGASTPGAAAEIVPGSVDRIEPLRRRDLRRRRCGSRGGRARSAVDSTATIRNTSGGADRPDRAQHDRRATRRHPAPTRSPSTGSPSAATRERPDDRRAARRHPAGRRHDPDPGPVPRHPAQQPVRLELAVHQGERDHRPLPLAAVGQPQDRLRPAEPRRPVRDADRAARSGSGSRPRASSCWRRPATGPRSAPTA